jgi:hypothetical protein
MIQVIGRFFYAPRPAWSGTYYGNRAAGQASDLLHATQFRAAQVVLVSGLCPASRFSRSDRDCPPRYRS